jgi:hypothetical protein
MSSQRHQLSYRKDRVNRQQRTVSVVCGGCGRRLAWLSDIKFVRPAGAGALVECRICEHVWKSNSSIAKQWSNKAGGAK